MIIPRVHANRTVAQFRVVGPQDSLLRRYLTSTDLQHMMTCDATIPRPGSREKLQLRSLDTSHVVLKMGRGAELGVSQIQYEWPLSAFQVPPLTTPSSATMGATACHRTRTARCSAGAL